jgi:hypothetical protein
MTDYQPVAKDHQVQTLDVQLVDVLAHLEALLRHSHSIQRALLKLRAEAPPPTPAAPQHSIAVLRDHAGQMREDCLMLTGIVEDMMSGIESLAVQKS